MGKVYTRFQTVTTQKPYLYWGGGGRAHGPYGFYKGAPLTFRFCRFISTPTIWFSLDRKRWVCKRELQDDGNILILTILISSILWRNLRLRFLIFTKSAALLRLEPDSDADNQPLRRICQQELNFEAVSVGSVGEEFLF